MHFEGREIFPPLFGLNRMKSNWYRLFLFFLDCKALCVVVDSLDQVILPAHIMHMARKPMSMIFGHAPITLSKPEAAL